MRKGGRFNRSTFPRIEQLKAGVLKIARIAGDKRKAALQRSGGDQSSTSGQGANLLRSKFNSSAPASGDWRKNSPTQPMGDPYFTTMEPSSLAVLGR